MIGDAIVDGRRRMPVMEKNCDGQGFLPIGGGHGGMDQEGVNCIVHGAQHPFNLAILSGGVRARGVM